MRDEIGNNGGAEGTLSVSDREAVRSGRARRWRLQRIARPNRGRCWPFVVPAQIQILMTPSLAAVAIIFWGNSSAFMSRISDVCAVLGGV